MKVLIVEDQRRLGDFLRRALSERAYTVKWTQTCTQAREALANSGYDLIILDLGLPDGDGLDLLHEWRRCGFNEPVLILSARNMLEDRIKGLDLGADDYLPKPFSLDELLAHIRALMRRYATVKQAILEHGDIRMDLMGHSVQAHGENVDLTSREFALLEVFMQNAGRTLTRSYITERIWPGLVDTNLLDVYISRLRGKLDNGSNRSVFKTMRGVGYQLT